MIILVVIVKAFDTTQFFFRIEVTNGLVIEGTCFNNKVYLWQTNNIKLNEKKKQLKAFPLNQEQEKDVHFHQSYSAQCLES